MDSLAASNKPSVGIGEGQVIMSSRLCALDNWQQQVEYSGLVTAICEVMAEA